MSLLNEFLVKILVEAKSKAAQDAERLGLERKPGFGLYGPPGKDMVTYHIVDGELVPVQQDQPLQPQQPTQQQPPQTKKRPISKSAQQILDDPDIKRAIQQARFGNSTLDQTQVPSPQEPERALDMLGTAIDTVDTESTSAERQKSNERKVEVLKELLAALKSGDVEQINAVIETHKIVMGTSGRLKARKLGGKEPSDIFGVFGHDDRGLGLSDQVYALLLSKGIQVGGKERVIGSEPPSEFQQKFKPASLVDTEDFTVVGKPLTYSNSTDVRGFSIGDDNYLVIRRNPKRLVETALSNRLTEILQSRGMSPEEAEIKAKEMDDEMALYNTQIKYLGARMQGSPPAGPPPRPPVKFRQLPPGKEGRKMLGDILVDRLKNNGDLSADELNTISSIVSLLHEAETTEEFDSNWNTFLKYLINDPKLRSVIPYVCETVEILRKAVGGRTTLIPTTGTFNVADVITLSPPLSKVLSVEDMDIDSISDNLQFVYVQVDIRSVKRDEGAASYIGDKIELTEFDSPECKTDLQQLCGPGAHDLLWSFTPKSEVAAKKAAEGEAAAAVAAGAEPAPRKLTPFEAHVKQQLHVIEKYLDDIIEYYNLPKGSTMAQVYKILSRGSSPEYDDKGRYLRMGEESVVFSKARGLNVKQLQLYSFVGYAFDAIYNRRMTRQGFTNTSFTDVGIDESNGTSMLGMSRFMFYKNLRRRGSKKTGYVYRDDGFQSKIENVDKTRTRKFR